jgi:hypothetical protein
VKRMGLEHAGIDSGILPVVFQVGGSRRRFFFRVSGFVPVVVAITLGSLYEPPDFGFGQIFSGS